MLDVTIKSIEMFRSYSGSTDEGCDPEIVFLCWTLDEPIHNSFLCFVCSKDYGLQKVQTPRKILHLRKKVEEDLFFRLLL